MQYYSPDMKSTTTRAAAGHDAYRYNMGATISRNSFGEPLEHIELGSERNAETASTRSHGNPDLNPALDPNPNLDNIGGQFPRSVNALASTGNANLKGRQYLHPPRINSQPKARCESAQTAVSGGGVKITQSSKSGSSRSATTRAVANGSVPRRQRGKPKGKSKARSRQRSEDTDPTSDGSIQDSANGKRKKTSNNSSKVLMAELPDIFYTYKPDVYLAYVFDCSREKTRSDFIKNMLQKHWCAGHFHDEFGNHNAAMKAYRQVLLAKPENPDDDDESWYKAWRAALWGTPHDVPINRCSDHGKHELCIVRARNMRYKPVSKPMTTLFANPPPNEEFFLYQRPASRVSQHLCPQNGQPEGSQTHRELNVSPIQDLRYAAMQSSIDQLRSEINQLQQEREEERQFLSIPDQTSTRTGDSGPDNSNWSTGSYQQSIDPFLTHGYEEIPMPMPVEEPPTHSSVHLRHHLPLSQVPSNRIHAAASEDPPQFPSGPQENFFDDAESEG